MIDRSFKSEAQRKIPLQSAEARRLSDSLSVLKIVLLQAPMASDPSERAALAKALTLVAALEDLHGDIDGAVDDLSAGQAADALKELCARMSAAFLEPLGLHCEAIVEDGYMSTDDFAVLRQVLPIVLAEAGRHGTPIGDPMIRVCVRLTREGWCCGVVRRGARLAQRAEDGAARKAAAALAEAAGARVDFIDGPCGSAVMIRLGLANAAANAAPTRFH